MLETYILNLTCEDRPGLVAQISSTLFENGGNILEAQQFDDRTTGRYFMRIVFESDRNLQHLESAIADIRGFQPLALVLKRAKDKDRVLLLVSKFDHCLGDLLYRTRIGEQHVNQGYGRFVFITSQVAMSGVPGMAHYVVAKTGVTGLVRARVKRSGSEPTLLA